MTKWGYQVQMRVKGKLKCFGTYKTLSEAKQVRISAELEYRPYVKEIINMEHKPIYLDGVDVSKCRYFLKDTEGQDYNTDEFVKGCCEAKGSCIGYEFAGYGLCRGDKDCYYKQLKRKEQECERLKWYLKEIRYDELKAFDIEWDEYETHCIDSEYSNIINLVEEALKERSSEDCRYDR